MTKTNNSDVKAARVSRRGFMQAAAVGTAGAALGVTTVRAADTQDWGEEVDVLVVGTGGAGLAAAAAALQNGASVKVIEKAQFTGGTTGKSGGAYWIPNNQFMQEAGLEDPKEDAMRYMCRLAYPHLYRADSPTFGMTADNYRLLEVLYDRGAEVIRTLHDTGAMRSAPYPSWDGQPTPDYYAHLPENKAPRGRSIGPADEDGNLGYGSHLTGQLEDFVWDNGGDIAFETAAVRVVLDENRVVLGVVTQAPDGTESTIRARKGVIFGSGGFTHNTVMRENYLRVPIMGGCAVPSNQGDLVKIAIDLGAQLGNMNEAWLQQEILDEVLEFASVPSGQFFLGGDSMVLVNKYGQRQTNEKMVYNERTRVHLLWDASRGEYTNRFMFMVFDDHARAFGGAPVPGPDASLPSYVMQADTLEELAAKIDAKLEGFEEKIGHFRTDATFVEGLRSTITRFNGFAQTGVDLDYGRGEQPITAHFNPPGIETDMPNTYLHPISDTGPYYAIIMAAGTLDTKGGPVFDEFARVLDTSGAPIEGLYVAGNAAASPSGQAYWGAGGTLGLALTFGYIAGAHAAARG